MSKGNYVGGICGGDLKNVGFKIYNTYNRGNISGQQYIGGIAGGAGKIYTIAYYSYNAGNISGQQYIGGIIGYHPWQAYQRYCYNIGEISGENNVGGIIGGCDSVYNIIPSYCYNMGKIIATQSYVGGIVGKPASSCPENCYYEENTALYGIGNSTLTTGRDAGTTKLPMEDMPTVISVINTENVFVEDTDGINEGYPLLSWQVE